MGRPIVHRVTGDSVLGRRMQQAKGARVACDDSIPADVLAHNRALDAARAREIEARRARRKEK
jgi:hypothetical protein